MNGAELLVRELKARSVGAVSCLCGNGLNPFLEAADRGGIRIIDTRNEQTASYMADSWGRLTGRVGVAAVSSGPGHTNAITGLANAFWDGAPMLLISGSSPQSGTDLDQFQEIDQVALAAPVCKYARLVEHAAKIPHYIHQAFSTALQGRPGPVHLTIPVDVLSSRIEGPGTSSEPLISTSAQRSSGDPGLVREAVNMLKRAKRPFILIGSGAFYSGAGKALASFAGKTDIPILLSLWDRGCLDASVEQFVGVSKPGINGAAALLDKADAVLCVGARIDYRISYGRPPVSSKNAKLITVHVDPGELRRNAEPTIGILGDPRSVVKQMVRAAGRRDTWHHRRWLETVKRARERSLRLHRGAIDSNQFPLTGGRLCREVKPFLGKDVSFIIDGGNIGQWSHMVLFDQCLGTWLAPGASGVVGYGIAAGMAAKFLEPEKPVLLLSGDGALTFNIADIETANRHCLPFVIVLADDAGWGIVREGQIKGYGEDRDIGSRLGGIDFARLSESLGGAGVTVKSPDEIGPAIAQGLQADRVTLIRVPIALGGPDWQF